MKVYAQQREMFAFHGEEPSRKPDLVMTLLVYAMAPSYAFENKAVWRRRTHFLVACQVVFTDLC